MIVFCFEYLYCSDNSYFQTKEPWREGDPGVKITTKSMLNTPNYYGMEILFEYHFKAYGLKVLLLCKC